MGRIQTRRLHFLSLVCLRAASQAKTEKRASPPEAPNLLEQLRKSLQSIPKRVGPALSTRPESSHMFAPATPAVPAFPQSRS